MEDCHTTIIQYNTNGKTPMTTLSGVRSSKYIAQLTNVSNFEPGVNSLENPKSAILIFISLSNSKFSAFKSLL